MLKDVVFVLLFCSLAVPPAAPVLLPIALILAIISISIRVFFSADRQEQRREKDLP